ncbi:hypothetical protein [Flavobacterium sp.]|jgi:hypothetical protein|uniref:hypothetical protein n=1 Tax=Flavobacterium sp. TaxID=239 RepID=UPI0037C0A0F6
MNVEEIKKIIQENKDKLPLSYNTVVIRNKDNGIPNETSLLKRKFSVNKFYKPITRF